MTDLDIHYEAFDGRIVEAVDRIVEIAKKNGSQGVVQTSHDWATIREIFAVYCKMYPEHSKDFIDSIKHFRKNEQAHGIGGDKGARIQHNLEVPAPFYSMCKAIFPDQKWDTKFAHKIAKELPALKPINDNY